MKELAKMPLLSRTDTAWAGVALADFDAFLLDHAACEFKAAAHAMSFVTKYPHKLQLVEPMICLAREELAHFHEVYNIIAKRGLQLASNSKDPYIDLIQKQIRHPKDEHFLDRLLVTAVVEARSCERLSMVADALVDPGLKDFYEKLARTEAGHYMIFVRSAHHYFTESVIEKRLHDILSAEADIVATLPHRPAVH